MDKGIRNMVKTAFVPMIIYYYGHQISAMVLLSLVSKIFPEEMESSGSIWTILAKMVAMMLGGAAVVAYYSKEKNIRESSSVEGKWQFKATSVAAIVIVGAVFSLSLNYLFAITGVIESSASYNQVAREQFSYGLLPALLFYGVVSPVVEEEVFRGIIYNSLKRNLGTFSAIIGSALLFGAIHGNIVQMLYGTFMGIIMAFIYERYGKLVAPILFHGAANVAIYLCTYFI